jgi:hypothetical protein
MALAVLLASLLVGALLTVPVGGRDFVVSGVDVAAFALFVWGLVEARRRGRLVVDRALVAYAGIFAVVVVQLVVFEDRLDLIGGASRFVGPALILVGLSQLLHSASDEGPGAFPRVWRWPELFAVFGSVLAVWIAVLLAGGLADPVNDTFYDVKNSISMPLGASNYVAAFVLVPAVALLTLGLRRRRYLLLALLPVAGVAATLSRGAFLGLAAGVAVGVAARWRPRAGVVTMSAVMILVAVASVLLGILGTSLPVTASTVAGRLVLLEASWDGFVAHPVIGVGLNSILEVTGSLAEPHVNAHNLVLQALVTTGILGAVAYLALWWLLVRRAARSVLAGDAEAAALAAAATALFVHAAAEALAHTRAVEALLAGILAIAATRPAAGARRERPWGSPDGSPSSIGADQPQADQR